MNEDTMADTRRKLVDGERLHGTLGGFHMVMKKAVKEAPSVAEFAKTGRELVKAGLKKLASQRGVMALGTLAVASMAMGAAASAGVSGTQIVEKPLMDITLDNGALLQNFVPLKTINAKARPTRPRRRRRRGSGDVIQASPSADAGTKVGQARSMKVILTSSQFSWGPKRTKTGSIQSTKNRPSRRGARKRPMRIRAQARLPRLRR